MFVVVKLAGYSFQVSNGFFTDIPWPIMFASILLMLENMVYLIQFSIFNHKFFYMVFSLMPVPAFFTTKFYPDTIKITKWFNAATQVGCYIPYVLLCIKTKTTRGVSMFGQHLNFVGSIFGMLMCMITCDCDAIAWLFYIIGLFQSMAVFMVAIKFGEFRILDRTQAKLEDEEMNNLDDVLSVEFKEDNEIESDNLVALAIQN